MTATAERLPLDKPYPEGNLLTGPPAWEGGPPSIGQINCPRCHEYVRPSDTFCDVCGLGYDSWWFPEDSGTDWRTLSQPGERTCPLCGLDPEDCHCDDSMWHDPEDRP